MRRRVRKLSRWLHTIRSFEPGQLAHRARFEVEARAGLAVDALGALRVVPGETPLAGVPDAGEAFVWRRRRGLEARWLSAFDRGRVRLVGTERAVDRPAFWTRPPTHDPHHELFELWSHAFVPRLGYLVATDPDRREQAERWLETVARPWMSSAEPSSRALRAEWHPWVVSRRLIHWLEACVWLRSAGIDDVGLEPLHKSFAVHVRWLDWHLERDIRGNHLMTNGLALLAAGLFFAEPSWLATGSRIWSDDLRAQVLGDGVHRERVPMYHAGVCAMALDALSLLERADRIERVAAVAAREAIRSKLPEMLGALVAMTLPDQRLTQLGDTADGVVPTTVEILTRAEELGLRPEGKGELSVSGLLRLDAPGVVAFVDAAPFGPSSLPAHGHCDAGSFELVLEGVRVIVDGGVFTYASGPDRQLHRGAKAHNVLVVPGREQSEIWGGFRVARRAWVEREPSNDGVRLVVHGYPDRVGRRLAWTRHLSLGESGVDVRDSLESVPPGARYQLILAPQTEVVSRTDSQIELETDGVRWRVSGQDLGLGSAWQSSRFGERERTSTVWWPAERHSRVWIERLIESGSGAEAAGETPS